jgi:multidrug resistance efflux pump
MSSIFGGGKRTAEASAAAAEKQMKLQKEQLKRQEGQLQAEQSELAKRTQASLRARQRGGQRMLMGDIDEESMLG